MRALSLFLLFTLFSLGLTAQFPERQTSADIYHKIQKLGNTATILYMAAHPDDENTRLISYFENKLNARVAYLSLTRGDGGQNLVGTEIGMAIGVLRTQELLQARAIDGGEQFFTRAVDFGYSKSADESFEKWGRENILRDAVWVIRQFRPDVIVTRFPPNNYAGHGHHEASAILAEEAIDAAADPEKFSDQLEWVEPWQVKRLYFNSSSWWDKELPKKARQSDEYLTIDIGEGNPIIGESYAQIAARSRSMHKSQGFGSDYPYGKKIEYLQYKKGEKADPSVGILDGITPGWKRFNAPEIDSTINQVLSEFNLSLPANSLPKLLEIHTQINSLSDFPLKAVKLKELEAIIRQCAGLSGRFISSEGYTTAGSTLSSRIEIVGESNQNIEIRSINVANQTWEFGKPLDSNELFSEELMIEIPNDRMPSNPYWLYGEYKAIYNVDGYENLGKPENAPEYSADVWLVLDNKLEMKWTLPLHQKVVDPAKALILNPVYISPVISAQFNENVLIAPDTEYKKLRLVVKNFSEEYSGTIRLNIPEGWEVKDPERNIMIGAGNESLLEFDLRRNESAKRGKLTVSATGIEKELLTVQEIDYDHIPKQVISRTASIELIPIDLDKGKTKTIGYIEGPGDDVAKYLTTAGYRVEIVTEEDLKSLTALSKYDAIVTGIRAFNTRVDLASANYILNQYVEQGGTWLVQYNTSRGLKADKIGPYPFELSRERVTDENAEARFLNPNHPVLNYPNKLGMDDFNGWVQERGLYFAGEWDSAFEPIISWNDPGEPSRNGGLIVARHGKGHFVYSGISFFREFPAGVPGAYRLMANILALGE